MLWVILGRLFLLGVAYYIIKRIIRWVEQATGNRYLKKFDALKLNAGYTKDRESALVEVVDTTYDTQNRVIEYHLGKILEVDLKKKRKGQIY